VNGTASGKSISNTFAFFKPGMTLDDPADEAQALSLSLAFASAWPTFASVALHDSYATVDCHVYAMGSPLLPAQVTAISAAGGDGGSQAFLQLAVLVREHVTRRGKGSQSRKFFSPISQDTMDPTGMTFLGPYQSAVIGNYDDMIAAIITYMVAAHAGAWSEVQISKKTFGGVYGRLFPITGHSVDPNVTSQRRRLGR
jgi:hypothetical protein